VAVVLDLKSRKVIGWSMKDSLEQTLVHEALEMAVGQRFTTATAETLLFHSDRGSQYAAHAYQERLQEQGITCSMSRRGNCWDNAPVESFFATLKKEEVHREEYLTHEQAKASLFYYMEVFYNRKRRHSALGYITSAHTTTSSPSLTNCPHLRGNSSSSPVRSLQRWIRMLSQTGIGTESTT
jgi:transposase InsO family protein